MTGIAKKYSELFVKAAYKRSANIAEGRTEAFRQQYRKELRKIKNDR